MYKQEHIERWQLDDNAPEAYERYLVPAFFAVWAKHLVNAAGIKSGERVLDVACGTGIVARTAASRIGTINRIAGIDINESMLSVARTISSRMYPEIEWRHGDAAALPYPEESFDVVFCQQAMQFFPDASAVLNEIHRVLVSGGRVALNVLGPLEHNTVYSMLSNALERYAGPEAGAMMRSPFPSWDIEHLRDLITDAKFGNVHITAVIQSARFPSAEEFLRQEVSSSPIAGRMRSLNIDAREDLLSELEESLREYTDDEGVVFPMETYIAIGYK